VIVTEHGFDVEPELAALLGDGSELAAEAALTGNELVEPVHFLAHLAGQAASIMRTDLLGPHGVDAAQFREHLYAVTLDDDRPPGMPIGVGAEVMSAASVRLLDAFEKRADNAGPGQAGEGLSCGCLSTSFPRRAPC